MPVSRRFVLLTAVLGALAAAGSLPRAAAQPPAPFKIGALGPITGGAAVLGVGEVNGIKLRLKELNYQLGGRKVELIVEDDAGDPTTGLTKAQKLIERDRVDVLLGPLLSHVVNAVQDYVGQKGVVQMTFVAQPPEAAKYPTSFVPSWNAVQVGRMLGDYAVRKLGHKKALIVSSKYVFGTRVSDGFRAGFTAAGGSIVREVYPPLGTADFAPFLAGLPAADAVFSFFPGADAIKYVKARQEYGLTMPLLAIISTVEGMLLPAQGDAALGSMAITHYLEDFTIPANRAFVAAYTKEYNGPPLGYYPALGYTLVQILEEALKRTGGKGGPTELVEAIKRVDFQSPQGRFRFDPEKRFPVIDYYVVRVVKKDGKLGYEVLDTLKEVRPE
ncbi:MAG TPA: ABC transporter substrate-binding protein [Methylomirabilota bacterium]|nr:ABC transporter substrate-binding protein [Methylomirabilota bacterium]